MNDVRKMVKEDFIDKLEKQLASTTEMIGAYEEPLKTLTEINNNLDTLQVCDATKAMLKDNYTKQYDALNTQYGAHISSKRALERMLERIKAAESDEDMMLFEDLHVLTSLFED